MDSPRARFEKALQAPQPGRAICELAHALRDEGMSQVEMYQLFDEFRALHQDDADETLHNGILDTRDLVVGWCSLGRGLFPHML